MDKRMDTACAIITLALDRIRELEAERARRAEQHVAIVDSAIEQIERLEAENNAAVDLLVRAGKLDLERGVITWEIRA